MSHALSVVSDHANEALHVLLVDDDHLIRLHISSALTRLGMSVTEAVSGEAAISAAQMGRFDIVLMDVRMPGMDGFATCESLKKLPNMQSVPVVMLTALEDVHSISRANEAGAIDYLTKPLNATVLAKRLQHIVYAQRNSIELKNEKGRQKALLTAIPDIVLVFDKSGTLVEANFPPLNAQRLQMRATPGSNIREIFYGIVPIDPLVILRNALKGPTEPLQIGWSGQEERSYDTRFVASDQEHVLCILRDTTEQIRQQRYIQTLSLTDEVTSLPNRAWYFQLAQRVIHAAPSEEIAVLKVSLDSFGAVTNSFGAKFSDKVIRQSAIMLAEAAQIDTGKYLYRAEILPFIARTADGEFHLLCQGSDAEQKLCQIANRILSAFNTPLSIDTYEIQLHLTLGVAAATGEITSAHDLFHKCGLAAQEAFKRQTTEPVVFTDTLHTALMRPIILETELRRALENGGIHVAYQPKVCAISGEILGAEALARWQHADLGTISPAEFIPIAEESGLVVELGEYILRQVCQQILAWQDTELAGIRVAVNVSGHQLNQESAEQRLTNIISDSGIDTACIELEITESVIAEQAHVIPLLQTLRDLGIKLALDDFGTGYSSLSLLSQFPIDTLKIDRSFIKGIDSLDQSHSITDAIIALGHALNLTLVAEGIETQTQLEYMQAKGCHLIQGYLTGKPMPAETFSATFERAQSAVVA